MGLGDLNIIGQGGGAHYDKIYIKKSMVNLDLGYWYDEKNTCFQ